MNKQACRLRTREAVARRYPRTVAHLIAASLGYAAPSTAAAIVLDRAEPMLASWC